MSLPQVTSLFDLIAQPSLLASVEVVALAVELPPDAELPDVLAAQSPIPPAKLTDLFRKAAGEAGGFGLLLTAAAFAPPEPWAGPYSIAGVALLLGAQVLAISTFEPPHVWVSPHFKFLVKLAAETNEPGVS